MSICVTNPSASGAAKPSPLLALVCLSVVREFDAGWITQSVQVRASEQGVSEFRVSRLKLKLLRQFEQALAASTRRGRRPFRPIRLLP